MPSINSYTAMNPLTDKNVIRCTTPPEGKISVGKGTVVINNRLVDVTVYRSKHSGGWKFVKGIQAFLMTLGLALSSACLLLLIPKVLETFNKLWGQAIYGLGQKKYFFERKTSEVSPPPNPVLPTEKVSRASPPPSPTPLPKSTNNIVVKPQAIRNHTGTCFINSALQLLMMIPSFIQHIENLKDSNNLILKLKQFISAWKKNNKSPADLENIVKELRSAYKQHFSFDIAYGGDAFYIQNTICKISNFGYFDEKIKDFDIEDIRENLVEAAKKYFITEIPPCQGRSLQDRIDDLSSNKSTKKGIFQNPDYILLELSFWVSSDVTSQKVMAGRSNRALFMAA